MTHKCTPSARKIIAGRVHVKCRCGKVYVENKDGKELETVRHA